MTDKITAARELLKKAILLNDAELISLANQLLGSEEQVSETVVQKKVCVNCNSEVAENKKSCPSCKKRKFKNISAPVAQTTTPIVQTKQPVVEEERGLGRRAGRRESIGPFKNQFVDDGTLAVNDKLFNKKYGKFFSAQPRNKPAAKPVSVHCERCHRPFDLSPALFRGHEAYYVCDRCVSRSI